MYNNACAWLISTCGVIVLTACCNYTCNGSESFAVILFMNIANIVSNLKW